MEPIFYWWWDFCATKVVQCIITIGASQQLCQQHGAGDAALVEELSTGELSPQLMICLILISLSTLFRRLLISGENYWLLLDIFLPLIWEIVRERKGGGGGILDWSFSEHCRVCASDRPVVGWECSHWGRLDNSWHSQVCSLTHSHTLTFSPFLTLPFIPQF